MRPISPFITWTHFYVNTFLYKKVPNEVPRKGIDGFLYAVYAYSMNELGKRIRELRDRHDISLREFARKLGDISPAHISDIENGRRNPSDDLLQKMAQVLGVAIGDLQRLDNRLPVEELRRAMRQDPALGFALRKAVEMNVSSEQILKWAGEKDADKKGDEK